MKRKALLILTCLFSLGAWATVVQTKTYEMNFSPQNFVVKSLKGDTAYIQCNLTDKYKVRYLADIYNPELPVIDVNLLIPGNCEIDHIGYTFTANPFANNIILNNGCEVGPIGDQNFERTIAKGWYAQKTYVPDVSLLSNFNVGRYRVAVLRISPFKYDAVKRQLLLCNFKVQVKFKSVPLLEPDKKLLDHKQRKVVENDVYNPSELNTLYLSTAKNIVLTNKNDSLDTPRYYIITADSLKDAFKPLAQWKMDKGYTTEIISMEQIGSCDEVSADTGAYKIKHYLFLRYHNRINHPTNQFLPKSQYILLGGDVNIVPTAYVHTNSYTGSPMVWLPCDMYYACIKNASSWYNRNHEITGDSASEMNDDGIYISRCPAQTKKQVETFVNKVVNYEKKPAYTNWGDKVFFCGQFLCYNVGDKSDVDTISRLLVNESHLSRWTNKKKGIGYLFNTSSNIYRTRDMTEDSYGFINAARVAEQIKGNYSLAHVYAHGTDTTWEVGNGIEPFTKSMADGMQSNYPKVILTEACHTNSFDKNESGGCCLAEAFMRNPNSGVVAYVGNSRQGLCGTQGPPVLTRSDIFSYGFLSALSDSSINEDYLSDGQLGKLILVGRKSLMQNAVLSNRDAYRWLNFEINSLGDPEMQLFTSTPKMFPDIPASLGFNRYGTMIYFDTKGIDDYTATIYYWFDNNSKQPSVYEHLAAVDSISYTADSLLIVLHKHNYKPMYIFLSCLDTYVQNQMINADTTYTGYKIFAGKDITNRCARGKVIVNHGETVLKGQKLINLQHGFEVRRGGSLKLDVKYEPSN